MEYMADIIKQLVDINRKVEGIKATLKGVKRVHQIGTHYTSGMKGEEESRDITYYHTRVSPYHVYNLSQSPILLTTYIFSYNTPNYSRQATPNLNP